MNDNLKLRIMSREELRNIYNIWMVKQFHEGELKPLKMMEALLDRQAYRVYGMLDGDELAAYALLAMAGGGRGLLLDYFAVLPHFQDKGYGGKCLAMLKEALKDWAGIIIEVENPDLQDDEAEREICRRRMRFYERNACQRTPVQEKLFGFEYDILFLPAGGHLSGEELFHEVETLYHMMVPPDVYEKNVFIRMK